MVVAIVVQVEDPDELCVSGHNQVVCILDAFAQGLASMFLHLDVVELPEEQKKKNTINISVKLIFISPLVKYRLPCVNNRE